MRNDGSGGGGIGIRWKVQTVQLRKFWRSLESIMGLLVRERIFFQKFRK